VGLFLHHDQLGVNLLTGVGIVCSLKSVAVWPESGRNNLAVLRRLNLPGHRPLPNLFPFQFACDEVDIVLVLVMMLAMALPVFAEGSCHPAFSLLSAELSPETDRNGDGWICSRRLLDVGYPLVTLRQPTLRLAASTCCRVDSRSIPVTPSGVFFLPMCAHLKVAGYPMSSQNGRYRP
jgi:hypothetical protein